MSELAGFGIPDWLPPMAARSVALAELAARHEDRIAAEAREARAEQRRAAGLEAYRSAAELRGEQVSPVDLASGRVAGRTVAAIFAEAEAQAQRADAAEDARMRRAGEAPQLNILFAEPVLHVPSSPVKRSISSRSRHWREWQDRRKAEADARAAVEASMDYGLVAP